MATRIPRAQFSVNLAPGGLEWSGPVGTGSRVGLGENYLFSPVVCAFRGIRGRAKLFPGVKLLGSIPMPRASVSARSVAAPDQPHLRPPEYLSAEVAAIWRSITEPLPVTWFQPEHAPLLEAYCWHIWCARRLTSQLQAVLCGAVTSEKDSQAVARLTRIFSAHTERMSSLAVRLRLTVLSSVPPQQRQRMRAAHVAGPKPWENWRRQPATPDA